MQLLPTGIWLGCLVRNGERDVAIKTALLGKLVWKYTQAAEGSVHELECICWKSDTAGKTEKDYQLWTSWSNADDAFYVEYRLF